MRDIKVLDVTLRDGGCVNDFKFGCFYMNRILSAQEESGVDIIELGYIDKEKGVEAGETRFANEKVIISNFLKEKRQNTKYVVMMDYGKFDSKELGERQENGIDGIRLAFHKKDIISAISTGREILEKGYELFIQPMITPRYADFELLQLINSINSKLSDITALYIVDSFGEMRPDDMYRVISLVDHNLYPSISLGFHSHNNIQMSYSNAIETLQFPTQRDLIIDSSIMGMGKGAGNLNTELLVEHLNLYYGKKYKTGPLLEVIDKVINQIHSEFYWGYSPEYYLSSAKHCSPSYASYFYNKHMLPIDQVGELLGMISEDKRISFDREYAEELYRTYNESKVVDDSKELEQLRQVFKEKRVLLVAPGKSINRYMDEIADIASRDDIISMGLNQPLDIIDFDYLFTTRDDLYQNAVSEGKRVIVPSNVSKGGRGNVIVLNYSNWITVDDRTHDSSSVMAMNLLKACGVKKLILAGFDGFSVGINDNYFDQTLRYPVNIEQVEMRNSFYKSFIGSINQSGIEVQFLTPSMYS